MLKLFLALSLLPALAFAEMTFKTKGVETQRLSLEDIQKKLTPQTVPIFELHDGTEKKYVGVNFRELLNAVYGKSWTQAEEILFTCRDGYQPTVPVAEFLKWPSYLVWAIEGGKFVVDNKAQNQTNIDLGPFYLVWDTVKHPELRKVGMGNWPYQLIGADLVSFKDRFPHIAPPNGAKPQVVRGFLLFRAKCLACHSLNGEGAPKSVELNYPVNITEYFKESWLEKWILDPRSVRFNSEMPALDADNPKQAVKDIIAYLKVMAKHKVKAPPPQHQD